MLLSLTAGPLRGFGGRWRNTLQLGIDQERQAGPMPWALPGQALGLESWAGSAEAEGDSGNLRMVKQGVPAPMSDQHDQGTTGHSFLSSVANRHERKGKLKTFEGHPV